MRKYLLMGMTLLFPLFVCAQVVTVKGVGTTTYSTWLTASDKQKAYESAQVSAVERYFAENGEAESQNFEDIEEKVRANLDKFILGTTVINEQDQSGMNKYTVAVRVELNVAKLRNTLRKSSNVHKATVAEKSQLVYVFVGREADSVRSYDARVVKRAQASGKSRESDTKSTSGHEGETITGNSISTSATRTDTRNVTFNSSVRTETGGSVTRKADKTTYRILPLSNAKTAITSVFSQSGFIVADPEFVLDDREIRAVNKDFSSGSDLAPSTMRSVVASLRKSNIPLLVLATLDVGVPYQDDATGMQRVAVTGRVLDLKSGLPREVASVPAVQYFGVGPDNATAQTKGLKDASVAAAREIVSRLNVAGVQ